jgi:hypothetical protein
MTNERHRWAAVLGLAFEDRGNTNTGNRARARFAAITTSRARFFGSAITSKSMRRRSGTMRLPIRAQEKLGKPDCIIINFEAF